MVNAPARAKSRTSPGPPGRRTRQHKKTVMNPIRAIRRAASILAALAAGLLGLATASPAAFARPDPHSIGATAPATSRPQPPGWNKHPPLPAHAHTVVTGGMPGWQITLIVAAAALLAALAVTAYRMRATRRRVTATTA